MLCGYPVLKPQLCQNSFCLVHLIRRELLPPANKVWEGYVFTGVCLSTGGSRSLSRGVSLQVGESLSRWGSLSWDLCPGGSLSGGALSKVSLCRGLCPGGLYLGVLCPGLSIQVGGFCPGVGSLSRWSLSKGSLFRGGLCPRESVQGGLCPGGSLCCFISLLQGKKTWASLHRNKFKSSNIANILSTLKTVFIFR